MELRTDELEKLICSANPGEDFIHYLNGLAKERLINFENFIEILFLKTIREKDSQKIWNISCNINFLKDGEDIRKVFYNVILTSLYRGSEEDFIYTVLNNQIAVPFIVKFIIEKPFKDIDLLVSKLNKIVPDFILYSLILDDEFYYPIHRFTLLFDNLPVDIKQKIILAAINSDKRSLISRINSFFEQSPISLNYVFSGMHDGHELIYSIRDKLDTRTLHWSFPEVARLILTNWMYLPYTYEKLITSAISENCFDFIRLAANLSPKKRIIELLFNYEAKDLIKRFFETFGDSPEIEHLTVFS